MTRIGAALDISFGKDTLQFIDFLYSNGFNHIEVRVKFYDKKGPLAG